jgi:hypothetical protein
VVAVSQITEKKADEEEEENPILVAQRYLNIYHQIHIFPPEKRAEFDASVKNMPNNIRHILPTIPGGRILLDHILELEGKKKKNYDYDNEVNTDEKKIENQVTPQQPVTTNIPIVASGKISLDPDFAKNLAGSLATAFRNNNLVPGGNLNELSSVLSKSFSEYASNMQQMTQSILSQNMDQLNKSQSELHTQFTKQLHAQNELHTQFTKQMNAQTELQNKVSEQLSNQINKQSELQNKITEQVGNQISQVQSQLNAQINKQLDWQNKMQSQFEQNMHLQNELQQKINSQISTQTTNVESSVSTSGNPHVAAQMNAQTNNANTTTINNINVDSSCFNGLSQTIRETEEKRSADFQKIIEVLNKNFANSHNQKSQEFPVTAITNSITEALRESSKQQLAAIKAFGETLSQTIRQSQQELAKTLSKTKLQPEKYIIQAAPMPVQEDKTAQSETEKNKQQNSFQKEQNRDNHNPKNEKKNESVQNKTHQQPVESKKNQPSEKQKTSHTESWETPNIKNDSTPLDDMDFVSAFKIQPETKHDDILLDDIFADTSKIDLDTTEIMPQKEEKNSQKTPSANSQPQKAENKSEPKVEPTPPPKPKVHSHLYDDAMSKIKAALQSTETVALDDLDDVNPVSLTSEMVEPKPQEQEAEYTDTPFDDSLLTDFLETDNQPADDSEEWEYVDEDGNPVNTDDSEEWEYVDEDGNPVNTDDSEEWEYVDEDGNPVNTDDSEEWEYVDEDGNPVNTDGSEEWEYVDEDGNPVNTEGSEEWEYVDEDGNPVNTEGSEEWEYVDEDGNPIDTDTVKENDLTSAFLAAEESNGKEDPHDK